MVFSDLVLLILDAVASPIIFSGESWLDPSVGLSIMVSGMLKDPSSFNVWTAEIPRFADFGILVRTASRVKFTQQHE